jgi:purine/pyrimidine-nucleoside phosphorylase|tara:strand:+ start:1009 stop:1323 length:315 start_codon:yes stop_codon:yes gene_type:complete
MSEFNNVKVNKEANIYFDGKVISRTITFADNSIKTLGVMLPGEYEFNTEKKELMEIYTGELAVLLNNSEEWEAIEAGMSFSVPAKSKFNIKIYKITNYCCTYFE